jgi:STE24 endopeptidase
MIQLNFLLLGFLAVFLFRSAAQLFFSRLNISYLRQHGIRVPEAFQDVVDGEKLRQASSYNLDSEHFHMVATLAQQGLYLLILLSGFLPWIVKVIRQWTGGLIVGGLIFFAIFSIAVNLLHLPFSLYDTFVIENRYGFNTMTLKTWISDLFKSITVSAILGGLILWFLLTLVAQSGEAWWVWAWMVASGFEILMMWLFPVLIAPLFNKFEPIENKVLGHRIGALMEKMGLRAKGVFKMDASKRSKHTNAYFTGIGRNKRIVLFDTLLASHTEEEILAVLAHEIGHWKKRHLLKEIILLEILSLVLFYFVSKCLNWTLLYQTFGFQETVTYAGLFLAGVLIGPLGFFAHPVESAISRKFEREADDFALYLIKTADPMRRALKRLAADNLANLTPHPLYAWFYYTHPPLVERISRLKNGQDHSPSRSPSIPF